MGLKMGSDSGVRKEKRGGGTDLKEFPKKFQKKNEIEKRRKKEKEKKDKYNYFH